MAAGVTFTRLSRGDLPGLVEAAREDDPQAFAAFLAENGSSVADFDGDGEIFSVLLPVLCDEYDIDLETGENEIVADIAEAREGPVLILTQDDKEKYFELLNPDEFEEDELGEAYEDFTEEEEEDAGAAMLEAISALYQALAEVDAGYVVVVTAG